MKRRLFIQKMTKVTMTAMLILGVLVTNVQSVVAAEIKDFSLESEMELKKATGEEVHEILDNNGRIMGYFLPDEENNLLKSVGYHINWSVPANYYVWGADSTSFVRGDEINVSISQNPSGPGMVSYLGLYDCDTGTVGFPNASITTNGWSTGVIRVGYSGHFTLAIKNNSSRTITYTGNYWF